MLKRNPRRSSKEWLQLITECRQSNLPDQTWCEQHDIPLSSFYNAVCRLRKEACMIPDSSYSPQNTMIDFTSRQDVVRVQIGEPDALADDTVPEIVTPVLSTPSDTEPDFENPHTIELNIGPSILKISNSADMELLSSIIRLLKGSVC